MYWVFDKEQLDDAMEKYIQRRFKTANPESMQKLLNDFMTSEEFKDKDMLRGDEHS